MKPDPIFPNNAVMRGNSTSKSPGPLESAWRSVGAMVVDATARLLPSPGDDPGNPQIALTRAQARQALARMAGAPKALERPVVILNGYHAWAGLAESLRRRLALVTSGQLQDFFVVSFMDQGDFDPMRRRVLDEVASRAGASGPFDVIGISMGGLLARIAAAPSLGDTRSLKTARLFTLASPHRGALLAAKLAPNAASIAMQPGSPFLARLEARSTAPRVLRCYALLGDRIVGATNTAPAESEPIWAVGPRLMPHFFTSHDPLFIADIASILRGEGTLLGEGSRPPRD